MKSHKLSNKYLYFAIIISVGVISVLPIAYYGIPDTIDTPQHYKFADIFYHSIQKGDFYPSWSDKENFGYGGIGIRFYPPLAYYFLAVLKIIVGNWYEASWISFMFWMILGSFGIYFWSRCWLSPKLSTVAACIYILIPIHLNHLYTSFNIYAEFAAASLLTFCFGYLTRIFQRDKWTDALGLGIFYGLLILAHLPFTIISSICLGVYALLLFQKKDGIKPLFKSFVGAIIGFAASSFYWVGMLSEMKWLKHASEKYSKGAFDYKTGLFPFSYYRANDTSFGSWIFDISTILTLLFLASSVAYFVYKSKNKLETNSEKSVFRTVLPLGLFAFFMVTPLSSFAWELITPLQKIQFPVRWLPVTAMCGAVVVVVSAQYFIKAELHKKRGWIYAGGLSIVAVVSFNAIYILHPTSFVPLSGERFYNYAITSPDSQSYHFWWTIWSENDAFKITDKLSAGDRSSNIITWEAENRVFEVSEGTTEYVRVATFYYPHWQATVNNQPITIEKDENGVMLIPVGKEKSIVKLYFQEPFFIQTASILSILTWLSIIPLILFAARKKFFSAENFPLKFIEKKFST